MIYTWNVREFGTTDMNAHSILTHDAILSDFREFESMCNQFTNQLGLKLFKIAANYSKGNREKTIDVIKRLGKKYDFGEDLKNSINEHFKKHQFSS